MSIHPIASASTLSFVMGDTQCNSPIDAHQSLASCVLSSSEPQAPGSSGLVDTDSDDDVRLAECGLVAVEVRKEKVDVWYVRDEEEGWAPVVRRKRKKKCWMCG